MTQPVSEGEAGESRGSWCVLVGPGPRLAGLAGLLEAAGAAAGRAVAVESLDDLADLLVRRTGAARVLLDGDELAIEDLGIVRRYLQGAPERSVVLLGGEARAQALRTSAPGAKLHCAAWPPDLDYLRSLSDRAATPAPSRKSLRSEAGNDIPVVRAGSVALERPGAAERRLELAELADIAQRLQLAFAQLCDAAAETDPGGFAAYGYDLERLLAFTRRLGEGAGAEPAEGAASARPWTEGAAQARAAQPNGFEVTGLVQERLAAVIARSPGAPRTDCAADGPIHVAAERADVAAALDTFLRLGLRCAGPNDEVRVRLSTRADATAPHVDVAMAWPSGPLARLAREELFEPGRLEALLPDVSAADLARAIERVEAGGGRVDLRMDERGFLRITVRLALAPPRALAGS